MERNLENMLDEKIGQWRKLRCELMHCHDEIVCFIIHFALLEVVDVDHNLLL